MSLGLAINNALSGLRVTQQSVDAVSNNIANAQTPGFTRKVLPQTAVVNGEFAAGVRAEELTRLVSPQLQRDYFRQVGTVAGAKVTENYLRKVEQLSGRPEDQQSIAAKMGELQQSFEALTATPESRTLQLDAINKAAFLARDINRMATSIQTFRNDANFDLAQSVTDINTALAKIAELNEAIVRDSQAGRSTVNLEDKRDEALKSLATQIDISYTLSTDKRMVVMTKSGQTLVERQAYPLSYQPSQVSDQSFYSLSPPGNIPGVRLGSDPNAPDITRQLTGGKVGALLELRDRTFPKLSAELDEFAHKMALRFRSAGLTLFSDDASQSYTDPLEVPPPAGDGARLPPDIVGVGGSVGFATRIRLNQQTDDPQFLRYGNAGVPTVPPSLAVSNAVVKRVIDNAFGLAAPDGTPHAQFRTANLGPNFTANIESDLPPTATLQGYIESLITNQGQLRATASTQVDQQTAIETALETRVTNESGVNLDQELGQLTVLQRSYGASAQVLRTVQQLLDDILALNR